LELFSYFELSGAGISTESGIPDYRSEGVGLYARTNHRPVKIQEFLSSPHARKRYWARNFIGWPTFSQRNPNAAHFSIEEWRKNGKVRALVTQNVDGLHQKAGTGDTIELHGTAHKVLCLQCQHEMEREEFQGILAMANPYFTPQNRLSQLRPDGDIHLEEVIGHPIILDYSIPQVTSIVNLLFKFFVSYHLQRELENFVLPSCGYCSDDGILQPDIVFFGANVKKKKVDRIYGNDSIS